VLGSAALALWAAAVCIVLLAIIGIASSARARVRSGRNDIAVLRALGLTRRDQARTFSEELLVVLVAGGIGGLLAGALVATLTIPYFARAALTLPFRAIGTGLQVDLVGLIAVLALLGAGAAIVVVGVRRRVARLVDEVLPGEESE
jgi:ABC-type antimicrobial peptide transport system permease subunit